jgi:hypothetical protein
MYRTIYQKKPKAQVIVKGDVFKRYAFKQNTQLEESPKSMLDKLGDEAVEHLNHRVPQERD